MATAEQKNILDIFATHPVAMNILMLVIFVAGIFVIDRINVQFFPDFKLDFVEVKTVWLGAAAEDVETSITNRLELELKNVDDLKNITSESRFGISLIFLEFVPNTDISTAKQEVQSLVDIVTSDLPTDADRPVVREIKRYELIANLVIAGQSIDQLRVLANEYKDDLLARGVGKINFRGLPTEEIAIQIPGETLRDLGLNLHQIGQRVQSHSSDSSVGISGRNDSAREIRFVDQRRSELSFEDVPVIVDSDGRYISLGDIATIKRQPKADQVFLTYRDKPAVQLTLQRQKTTDTLNSADILYTWMDEIKAQLPPSVEIAVYADQSIALRDRLRVLINNGLAGLVLVLIVLYVFLNTRLAFWVAMGIPVSLFGAVTILYLAGGTLNMITLFGFIMTIGIIVDDAIVVGEDALTRFSRSSSPAEAACGASRRMFVPIVAASLTTIFAFLPVMIVSGIIGIVLGQIALVVVCVVATSLIEAFLILPGHLRHSFEGILRKSKGIKKSYVDRFVERVRDHWFRRAITLSISNPITTICVGLGLLIVTVGLFASGRLQYSFFPTPELNQVFANVTFTAGTPKSKVDQYLQEVESLLHETDSELGGNLVRLSVVQHGATHAEDGDRRRAGRNHGSVIAELIQSDLREVRTTEFLRKWQSKIQHVPGLETVIVLTQSAGPPGRDIEVEISGPSKTAAKDAAISLSEYLQELPGVYGILDNTSYGNQQQILKLTPLGQVLGLSVDEISRQLRSSIEGIKIQSFTTKYHDIEVKLTLPAAETNRLSELDNIHIVLPSGESVPLLDVVVIHPSRGFDSLLHRNGDFSIEVSASVDESTANTNEILQHLDSEFRPQIEEAYGVTWAQGQRQEDQTATEQSMQVGALIAFILIYLTLAWIFGSYTWPLFVMLAIPFGIVGAAWGHFFLGIPFTIITILGLIGLSGIVVNNAIVLVVFYKRIRIGGLGIKQAMIEAGCRRLRPVVLSTLTTIVGLLPLLFEKSTQAQFLIPMAVTLVFGLAFSTVLVLFFIPAILTLYEDVIEKIRDYFSTKSPAISEK